MSEWSMVWLQQKGDDEDVFTPRNVTLGRELTQELQKSVTKLQRHTKASGAKVETPLMRRYHIPSFTEHNKYKWDKTTYFEDCKKCLYNDNGAVKKGTKK